MADYSFIPVKTTDIPEEGAMTAVKEFLVNTETEQTRVILKGDVRFPASQITNDSGVTGATAKDALNTLNTLNTSKAADNSVVHLTGNETVAGVKTFSSSPIVPHPATATQADTKGARDTAIAAEALIRSNADNTFFESLPTVGIAVARSGTGTASTTISIYTLIATTATITGGTFSNGLTTLSIPAKTNTSVVFSLSSTVGLILIKGMTKINSVTVPSNAPIPVRDAVWLLPSVMTYFVCGGNNTLSGVLSLPSVMTDFTCIGNNTLSGVLSLPSVMKYLTSTGNNTLTYPSVGTNVFPTTFQRFYIRPQSTWTSTMTDAVLIDAAATITTAFGDKVFDIRGNAGARTSASDSAKAYLESIGFTILTN